MAALQVGGLHFPCISRPRILRADKALCSCSYSDHPIVLCSPRFSNLTELVLRSSDRQQHGCVLVFSKSRRSLQALSFQDVAENDSDGNDAASPSSSSPAPMLDRQRRRREKIWQQFQGSLQILGQNLTDRGSSPIAKQFLAITDIRTDAKENLTRKLENINTPNFSTLWSKIDPSIKWPIVIFLPFYLLVTASFGVAVSKELWPLWTIWPLATSFYIHAGIRAAEKLRPVLLVLFNKGSELFAHFKSGKAQQEARKVISSGINFVTTRPSALMLYLRTSAGSDLRAALARFGTWLMERYEDLIDWLWPSWRVFWRALMNLF